MRLYDLATGELRQVELRPRMGVYVCGITPYDAAHLGHAFTYTHFDVLVRYLRHLGSEVNHVQNVTDVDDDILRVANERDVDWRELGERETALFERQMEAIGNAPPTVTPRATEFIPQMIEEVEKLLVAGCAYVRTGTVYFRLAADPRYGSMWGLSREEMLPLSAERGGHPEDPNKDDPLDFVLWQASQPGEPTWESPWGPGRPGWHIECSTMAGRLLGRPVDIHGGGSDLIYPHHESERAQAECARGSDPPFVRRWVHTGAVHQAAEKMSKSLGNMTFVDDLLERYEPQLIRRYLLSKHYRRDWEFVENDLRSFARSNGPDVAGTAHDRDSFFEALDDDLNAPRALAVLDLAIRAGDDWVGEGCAVLGLGSDPAERVVDVVGR